MYTYMYTYIHIHIYIYMDIHTYIQWSDWSVGGDNDIHVYNKSPDEHPAYTPTSWGPIRYTLWELEDQMVQGLSTEPWSLEEQFPLDRHRSLPGNRKTKGRGRRGKNF